MRDWERARQHLAEELGRRSRSIQAAKAARTPDVSRIAIWEGELDALSRLHERLGVDDGDEISAILAGDLDRLIGAEFAAIGSSRSV